MKKWLIIRYFSIMKRLGNKRKWILARNYYRIRKRMPDFDNPTDFSEYIMAGILREKNDMYAGYADKVLVKKYVESKGLGDIVPKCLGVWDRSSDIDYDKLPRKFALKINHGCGYNLFCWDKSTFDTREAGTTLDGWLHETYSELETHYRHIEPKIFAEELIDDLGRYPVDYRIYCFNGRPAVIDCTVSQTDTPSASTFNHYLFDTQWNYMSGYSSVAYDDWNKVLSRPKNLEKMMEYACILSADFKFVRVDLYDLGNRVCFGELTFTPSVGMLSQFNDRAIREMYGMLEK